MNPRTRKLIAIVIVVAIAAVAWLTLRSREPKYEGKKLTEWLEQYGRPDLGFTPDPEAANAIRKIGTNAIPLLLKYLSVKDSPLKNQIIQFVEKQENFKVKITAANEYHEMAVGGFHALGKMGCPAIPSLLVLMNDTNAGPLAVDCLYGIGNEATDALIQGLKNTNSVVRGTCAGAIGEMGTSEPEAISGLVSFLHDQDSDLRRVAIMALGRLHQNPAQVVPALIRCLDSRYESEVLSAAFALAQYGTNALSALPVLENVALKESVESPREVIYAISKISLGKANSIILKMLDDPRAKVRWNGVRFLNDLESSNRQVADMLFARSSREQDPKIAVSFRDAAHRIMVNWRSNSVPERATFQNGFLVRGPQNEKRVAICLWGDKFSEGADVMLDELESHHAKASFFLTDNFPSDRESSALFGRLFGERLYIGFGAEENGSLGEPPMPAAIAAVIRERYGGGSRLTESEASQAQSPLVSRRITAMHIERGQESFMLTCYGSYDIAPTPYPASKTKTLIAPTPGTLSGLDNIPEAFTNFVSSQAIFDSILTREREDPHGLNGYILMFHFGSGPGRADKFHTRFGGLLDALAARGYTFVRVDELFEPKEKQ